VLFLRNHNILLQVICTDSVWHGQWPILSLSFGCIGVGLSYDKVMKICFCICKLVAQKETPGKTLKLEKLHK